MGGSKSRRGLSKLAITVLVSCIGQAAPPRADAKTILVVVAHPDDEVLMAAGRTRTAVNDGDTIKTVITTNGDIDGVASGLEREANSVASAQVLGLNEQDVIFLGYPDGGPLRRMFDTTAVDQVFTSAAGQRQTYGNRGLGGMDYHRYLYGVPGPYNRRTVAADFRALLANFRPDEVYTHSYFDAHQDHQSVALFLTEALLALKRSGIALPTVVYESIVWMPSQSSGSPLWPQLTSSGWTPTVPFLQWTPPCVPGDCLDLTQLEWSRMQRMQQPAELLLTDPATNLKALAIPGGVTNAGGFFASFVRKDEFFWRFDFARDLSTTAQVTVSSQGTAANQSSANAVDGVVGGLPGSYDVDREWVSANELAGAWMQVSWPTTVRVGQVNLHDRPSTAQNVLSGRLTFSDGSSIDVGALPANGAVLPVTFPRKTVTWVRFTVTSAEGTAAGLSELEVLGVPATTTANVPPHFVQGPVPALDTITSAGSTSLHAVAHDLDGNPLRWEWSADAGTVQGAGADATFTPPAVTSATYVGITARVLDGHGGTATNRTFVRVTPAPAASLGVDPSRVFGGDPSQGSIALNTPAPAGGQVVALASDRAAATVPPSVLVPSGAYNATFPIATTPVAASTTAVITARLGDGTVRTASLTLAPRSCSSLALTPTSVLGGDVVYATVTLPVPAGPSGAVVALASTSSAVASVPGSVSVPAGSTTATFPVTTSAVTALTSVTLSATFGTTASAALTVRPLAVSALSLAPAQVVGGSPAQGTIVLDGPASQAVVVALSSGAPDVASVPGAVTIPAGADRATFSIATAPVAASVPVSITASYAGSIASATLMVSGDVPPPSNPNLLQNPEQIGAAGWDRFGDLAVTTNVAAAPDGTQHATRVVSSGGGHALRHVVSVVPGTTYTFSFFARNGGGLAASCSVYDYTHGAEIVPPASYFSLLDDSAFTRVGVTFAVPPGTTEIGVYPVRDSDGPVDVLLWGAKLEVGAAMTGYDGYGAESLVVSPASVVSGGTVQGMVTLSSPAPAGGTIVTLSSSTPAAAAVPASVTVPAGATLATFTVTTGTVAVATVVTLSAALPGGTQTALLTVTPPPGVSALGLSPTTVLGGGTAYGTVTLSAPAGSAGEVVALASTDSAVASVPSSVRVPAGATTATFPVTTSGVTGSRTVTISATLRTTASAVLTVTDDGPPPTSNLLQNPEQIGAAGWDRFGDLAVTTNVAAAPDGTQHATRVVSSGGGHALRQVVRVVPGTTYTFSFFARNGGGLAASYSVYDYTHSSELVPPTSFVSLLGDSTFTRVGVTFAVPPGTTEIGVYPVRDSDGPVDVLLWGAKLEVGSTMTAY